MSGFLNHLEADRGNSPRTRNVRLAALKAFFRYVALCEPSHALQCRRVLAIPAKRHDRSQVKFLSEEESVALVAAPDQATWIGRRDHTLLFLAIQTGLGKGRKMRCTPLRLDVAAVVGGWLEEIGGGTEDPVFPSSRGGPLSADALEGLVRRHVVKAQQTCPTLARKRVTPHTLRHTAAMDLLRRGIDLTVIALWLGHESPETTRVPPSVDQGCDPAVDRFAVAGLRPDRLESLLVEEGGRQVRLRVQIRGEDADPQVRAHPGDVVDEGGLPDSALREAAAGLPPGSREAGFPWGPSR